MMEAVLLLNSSYEPLRTVSLSRAVSLLMADKVDLVETVPGRELRSPSQRQAMPSVLRLRRYVNVPRRGLSWSKRSVLARDQYTCQYCGRRLTKAEATVDHITPQWMCRRDGFNPDTWANTVAACRKCQQRKGGRTMREAGMRFYNPQFEPKTPRANYVVIASDWRPEWRQYIRI